MKNQMSKSGKGKQRKNPVNNRPTSRIPRPKISFDGNLFKGTNLSGNLIAASNLLAGYYTISCHSTNSIASSINAMLAFYKEYKFLSVTMEWCPLIGPGQAGAGSRMHVGYLDNVELMNAYAASTPTNMTSGVKGLRDMRNFNVWEKFSYPVPLTTRRKIFDVDSSVATTAVEVIDRTMQGMFVYGCESINASETLGAWRMLFTLEVRGLTTIIQA